MFKPHFFRQDNTNDEDEDDEETDEDNDEEIEDNDQVEIIEQQIQHITVDDFLKNPIGKNLLSLQGNKTQSFIDHVTKVICFVFLRVKIQLLIFYLSCKFNNYDF